MPSKSQRITRFPGLDQTTIVNVRENNVNTNRQTRFPGGTELQKISILEADEPPIRAQFKGEEATQIPSRLPLRVNPPDTTSTRPEPVMKIKTTQQDQRPSIRMESPWSRYTALRTLERGGEVTAACTRNAPIDMVAVKRLSFDNFKELATCQHENLLAIIEAFRFEGVFFVITDYTAATLMQIIAIPLPLEELHVSATCRQGSPLPHSASHLANMLKVFEGMQHLSRFGLAHKTLDSSKILFSSDGCVKIGIAK